MELETLHKTLKGFVPLYSLKVGDKYRILDSQCYAKIVEITKLKWPDNSPTYHPIQKIAEVNNVQPALLVSYEAYFPDGRLVHGNPGKYIQVVEVHNKMVKQII